MRILTRVRTKVLPGNRVEVSAPELPEGASVEVLIQAIPEQGEKFTLYEWLTAEPPQPKPRSAESWEEYEMLIQQEREAWDR